jgi:threonine dehydrogenase-like Zn-dependent dehydrogenase
MRALWLESGRLELRDVPRPEPPPGEALVRVRRAGVCGTDLELVRGYYPFAGVPGHEFVGEVVAAPGAREWEGRRVVGEINAACASCDACRRGRRAHCEKRTVLGIVARHGAFAEYLTLPIVNLHAVPDALADDVAVFTEPAAAALHVLDAVPVGPGERVVVIGAGRLGILVAQALRTAGCEPLVVGRDEARLSRVAQLGLDAGTSDDIAPRRADVVVECTGNPEGLALARQAVRACGTIVLKSTYHGEARVNLSSVVVDELTLVGSRCGPFAPALEALAQGALQVEALIDARYHLEQAREAFEQAARPGTMKVLVQP